MSYREAVHYCLPDLYFAIVRHRNQLPRSFQLRCCCLSLINVFWMFALSAQCVFSSDFLQCRPIKGL